MDALDQLQSAEDLILRTATDRARYPAGGLPGRPSRKTCTGCGEPIPQLRRSAVPGVQRCIACQRKTELELEEGR